MSVMLLHNLCREGLELRSYSFLRDFISPIIVHLKSCTCSSLAVSLFGCLGGKDDYLWMKAQVEQTRRVSHH